jgi:hypothetical protein
MTYTRISCRRCLVVRLCPPRVCRVLRWRDGCDKDDVDERSEEAADGAPLDGDGHHAVHDEEDKHVVPDHHVAVQVQARVLGAQNVEGAT